MTDITIPPEALEAAARALCKEDGRIPDIWELYETEARAACLAMLEAWPGKYQSKGYSTYFENYFDNIILPLTDPRTSGEYAAESGDCGGC